MLLKAEANIVAGRTFQRGLPCQPFSHRPVSGTTCDEDTLASPHRCATGKRSRKGFWAQPASRSLRCGTNSTPFREHRSSTAI